MQLKDCDLFLKQHWFDFLHPHNGSQTTVTPISGDLKAFLISMGTRHVCGAYTYRQAYTPVSNVWWLKDFKVSAILRPLWNWEAFLGLSLRSWGTYFCGSSILTSHDALWVCFHKVSPFAESKKHHRFLNTETKRNFAQQTEQTREGRRRNKKEIIQELFVTETFLP